MKLQPIRWMTVYKEDVEVYVDKETKGINFLLSRKFGSWVLKYQHAPLYMGTLQECKDFARYKRKLLNHEGWKEKDRKIPYRPISGSWPFKTLYFLREHGESPEQIIRNVIGMDEHYRVQLNAGVCEYSDRSRYYFGMNIAPRLLNAGLMERTRPGWYRITELGKDCLTKTRMK